MTPAAFKDLLRLIAAVLVFMTLAIRGWAYDIRFETYESAQQVGHWRLCDKSRCEVLTWPHWVEDTDGTYLSGPVHIYLVSTTFIPQFGEPYWLETVSPTGQSSGPGMLRQFDTCWDYNRTGVVGAADFARFLQHLTFGRVQLGQLGSFFEAFRAGDSTRACLLDVTVTP